MNHQDSIARIERRGPAMSEEAIVVRGARTHNLRSVDADLPRGRIVALTGVSGSGKSSLAFDTIHAEGRRRFIESLSSAARQFVDQLERPDVDAIEGLPPTAAIDQRSGAPNPRSTVATLTEISDYLRLLYARLGLPHCSRCGKPVRRQTPEQIVRHALALGDGKKVILLAPLVRGQKGEHGETFDAIRRAGLIRARVDGTIHDIGEVPKLAKTKSHTIEAVIDRLVIREGMRPRLAESVDLALKLGDGTIVLSSQEDGGGWSDLTLSSKFACPDCGIGLAEVEPRVFSFNSPHGACPRCQGIGAIAANEGADDDDSETIVCPSCGGARLRPEALAVTLGGLSIADVSRMPISESLPFLEGLEFDEASQAVAKPLRQAIGDRLRFLIRVGLEYLSLDRPADTLSGGELQRARLAAQVGSGLTGVCYVLDEPTAGLHPRDADRLIQVLRDLRDQGNTVLVVEHDESTIRAADWVVDLGPGPGKQGGRIVAQGPPDDLRESVAGESLTLRHFRESSAAPSADVAGGDPRGPSSGRWLRIIGASEQNLRGADASFPIGGLSCVTGVSGSGKSTLVLEVLAKAARRVLHRSGAAPGRCERIEGLEAFDKLAVVDQAPIGSNARSTPATFVGTFDVLRRVYARTREAKIRGYGPSRFSFNAKGGRCEGCLGLGERRLTLSFLPEFRVRCDACQGKRFNRPTLEPRFKGLSIGDALEMTVDEALGVFSAITDAARGLSALAEAGLGYVALGQSASTLSGGEAQRVKLAAELARPETGKTLFILDEPTTGLHFADVANLLRILRRLTGLGNTVIVIEHHLDVIRAADWIVDLGPEGGKAGGRVLVAGTPADVAACSSSATGTFLARTLRS